MSSAQKGRHSLSLVVRVENISPLLSFSHFKRSQRHGQCSLCASQHDHPLLLRKTILKEFLKDVSLAVVLTFLNLQTKRNFFLLYAIVTADLTDCCLPHHQQQLFKKLFFHARFLNCNFISLTDLDQRGGEEKGGICIFASMVKI